MIQDSVLEDSPKASLTKGQWHSTLYNKLYRAVQFYTMWYNIVVYYIVWCSIVIYGVA